MSDLDRPRMTGIWEMVAGPPLRREDPSDPNSMLALLRGITEAIPPDAPVQAMSVQLGEYRWEFRRLAPLTLLEGPDGAYAVLSPDPQP